MLLLLLHHLQIKRSDASCWIFVAWIKLYWRLPLVDVSRCISRSRQATSRHIYEVATFEPVNTSSQRHQPSSNNNNNNNNNRVTRRISSSTDDTFELKHNSDARYRLSSSIASSSYFHTDLRLLLDEVNIAHEHWWRRSHGEAIRTSILPCTTGTNP
jgi:hypothetical protein